MANRFFVNGGVDNNWGTTGNWSTTSGGAGGSSVPTSSDDVFLDGNSPNCTVAATASCRQLDCTGYSSTLTLNANLTASPQTTGAVTFVAAMTLAGASILKLVCATSGSATLTTNGLTFTVETWIGGSASTWTLADDFTITSKLALGTLNAAVNITLNGVGKTVTATGNIEVKDRIFGTAGLLFTGTSATLTFDSNSFIDSPTEINTSGTITMTGAAGRATFKALTLTAGTVAGYISATVGGGGGGGAWAYA